MSDLSVQGQIKKLVDLQKIDGEIYQLNEELKMKPSALDHLKREFDEVKGVLTALETKAKTIQMGRKEKELELKSKEDEITKAQGQLSQLKTNKEYTAKLSEIEHIKADKSIIEEKILILYEEGDAVHAEVEKRKVQVAGEEKKYLEKKKTAEDEIKLVQDRIRVLTSQRQQALDGVDANFLRRYDQILKHKGGVAIVPVQNGTACGGCYMNITTQQVNMIRMHNQLVECEICSRILYIQDDL